MEPVIIIGENYAYHNTFSVKINQLKDVITYWLKTWCNLFKFGM